MSSRILSTLFKPRGLLSLVMVLMVIGILILLNTVFVLLLAARVGAYGALGFIGLVSLVSTIVFWSSVVRYMGRIRSRAKAGIMPQLAYIHLAGLIVCLIIVVIPGPITAIIGWLLYIPPFRLLLGAVIYRYMEEDFTALHEDIQVE